MSKILNKGDIGFGLMFEQDAGYISPELNKHLIGESVNLNIDPSGKILINCVLQKYGVKNRNGRVYSKEILMNQVFEYQKLIDAGYAGGACDHPECVLASESMICTREGWKNFTDISDNEEVLTLNPDTNLIEIQRIDKKIYEHYKGKMYQFKSRSSIDITVTPNHRFLLENRWGKRKYYTAEDIYNNVNNIFKSGKYKILKTGDWVGKYDEYFTLKGVDNDSLAWNTPTEVRERYTTDFKIKSEDWFAFMGIYLSEGHSSGTVSGIEKLNGYTVTITQKKDNIKKRIVELLDNIKLNYRIHELEDGKVQYHINDARLYDYLFKLGNSHTKYIPVELKQASSDLLNILFEWFLLGDGRNITYKNKSNLSNPDKEYNRKSVFSTSKKLIYDLKEILFKIGISGNVTNYEPVDRYINEEKKILDINTGEFVTEIIPRLIKAENSARMYNLNYSKPKHNYLSHKAITLTEIDVDDYVACVQTPNTNFYVMVNGRSHWTGNSSNISLNDGGGISHFIRKMWWGTGENEHVLYGQIELVVTDGFLKYGVVSMPGDKVLLYINKYGARIGISSRGVGSIKEVGGVHMVQSDFELIGWDLVSTPSTPGAFLFPEMNQAQMQEKVVVKGKPINENINKKLLIIDDFLKN